MQNNHANFTHLYNSLKQNLYNYINLRVSDKEEVSDLVQDVFLKAYNSWKDLPDETTAKKYLYLIARQRMIDLWRSARNRYEKDLTDDFEDLNLVDTSPLPEDIFEQNERQKIVRDLLEKLSPPEKQLIYLRYIEELEYRELSEIYNLSEDNIRQKMSRALTKLKKVAKNN